MNPTKLLPLVALLLIGGCGSKPEITEIPIKNAPAGMHAYLEGNTIHIVQDVEDTVKEPPEKPITAAETAFILDTPHLAAIGARVAEAMEYRQKHPIK